MINNNDLKTFVENLLDGETIDEDFFYELANVAKTKIEEERDWRILENDDSSNTHSPGDTFLTTHNLPTRFANTIELFTAKSDGSGQIYFKQIPFRERHSYQNYSYRYYIDLANSIFALCGKTGESRTIHLIYKKFGAPMTDSQTWVFPSRFWPLLGFMIATMYKAGVDYDEVNLNQAVQNNKDAKDLWDAMMSWDTEIRLKEGEFSYDRGVATDADGLPSAAENEVDIGLF